MSSVSSIIDSLYVEGGFNKFKKGKGKGKDKGKKPKFPFQKNKDADAALDDIGAPLKADYDAMLQKQLFRLRQKRGEIPAGLEFDSEYLTPANAEEVETIMAEHDSQTKSMGTQAYEEGRGYHNALAALLKSLKERKITVRAPLPTGRRMTEFDVWIYRDLYWIRNAANPEITQAQSDYMPPTTDELREILRLSSDNQNPEYRAFINERIDEIERERSISEHMASGSFIGASVIDEPSVFTEKQKKDFRAAFDKQLFNLRKRRGVYPPKAELGGGFFLAPSTTAEVEELIRLHNASIQESSDEGKQRAKPYRRFLRDMLRQRMLDFPTESVISADANDEEDMAAAASDFMDTEAWWKSKDRNRFEEELAVVRNVPLKESNKRPPSAPELQTLIAQIPAVATKTNTQYRAFLEEKLRKLSAMKSREQLPSESAFHATDIDVLPSEGLFAIDRKNYANLFRIYMAQMLDYAEENGNAMSAQKTVSTIETTRKYEKIIETTNKMEKFAAKNTKAANLIGIGTKLAALAADYRRLALSFKDVHRWTNNNITRAYLSQWLSEMYKPEKNKESEDAFTKFFGGEADGGKEAARGFYILVETVYSMAFLLIKDIMKKNADAALGKYESQLASIVRRMILMLVSNMGQMKMDLDWAKSHRTELVKDFKEFGDHLYADLTGDLKRSLGERGKKIFGMKDELPPATTAERLQQALKTASALTTNTSSSSTTSSTSSHFGERYRVDED